MTPKHKESVAMNFFSKEQLQKIREDKAREYKNLKPTQRIEHDGKYGRVINKTNYAIDFVDNATGKVHMTTQAEYVSVFMMQIEINNTIADEIREGTLQEHFVAGK